MVKNPPANAEDVRNAGSIPGWGRSPGGGHDNPLWYSCLEKSHEQRSPVGYSPWGYKELDMTEVTERTHILIMENNGTKRMYYPFCLEPENVLFTKISRICTA